MSGVTEVGIGLLLLRDKSKELTEQDGLNRGFRYSAIRQKPQIVGLNGEIVAVCTIEQTPLMEASTMRDHAQKPRTHQRLDDIGAV